jgi:hypothetical protein
MIAGQPGNTVRWSTKIDTTERTRWHPTCQWGPRNSCTERTKATLHQHDHSVLMSLCAEHAEEAIRNGAKQQNERPAEEGGN